MLLTAGQHFDVSVPSSCCYNLKHVSWDNILTSLFSLDVVTISNMYPLLNNDVTVITINHINQLQ